MTNFQLGSEQACLKLEGSTIAMIKPTGGGGKGTSSGTRGSGLGTGISGGIVEEGVGEVVGKESSKTLCVNLGKMGSRVEFRLEKGNMCS
ncbi:hypothetical protein KY289_030888 [Solanum tuberosum]|nr:hypothetical protein KY289_030888 [Solanum tuberosum]